MKITKITCDSCERDITYTDDMPAFRLRLTTESLQHLADMICAVIVDPQLERDYYFCDLACLCNWAEVA